MGYIIDHSWSDFIARLVRARIRDGTLLIPNSTVICFRRHENIISWGRYRDFIKHDRITGREIYPKEYVYEITQEQYGTNKRSFNVKERILLYEMERIGEPLRYYKVAYEC